MTFTFASNTPEINFSHPAQISGHDTSITDSQTVEGERGVGTKNSLRYDPEHIHTYPIQDMSKKILYYKHMYSEAQRIQIIFMFEN